MHSKYEAVIGLEVHAELETNSKMFCTCAVVEPVKTEPNFAVCPVCTGMPGVLPVINKRAVEFALKVAIALNCNISETSVFARKNYFYPDLPKGYQISQYDQPLARNGYIMLGEKWKNRKIRVRRVHLEEDTGKLTHISDNSEPYSLIDLNRAGLPLLEIVSEPDIKSASEARDYASSLRLILQYLGVNSGNMQKGVFRIEPNVSLRPTGSLQMGTRTEIKNLNSFRALERGIRYEIKRQGELLDSGEKVIQQTVGWDEQKQVTFPQRTKEEEEDYRYFPEPDLPPLVVSKKWLTKIRANLPELPESRARRFQDDYSLNKYDTEVLIADKDVADYFEGVVHSSEQISPKFISNWITGDLYGLMNKSGVHISDIMINTQSFGKLLHMLVNKQINRNSAKLILERMFNYAGDPEDIVVELGLKQLTGSGQVAEIIDNVLEQNQSQVSSYLAGKDNLAQWFFGQIMRATAGKADPRIIQKLLGEKLKDLKSGK